MFVPVSTLMVLIIFAFMLGMLTSFVMVIQAMLRFKK